MIDLVVELMKTLDHGDSRLERDISSSSQTKENRDGMGRKQKEVRKEMKTYSISYHKKSFLYMHLMQNGPTLGHLNLGLTV
jgi:hypothetical protein